MTFIDAHTHTFLRGPEDLSAMAQSGVRTAVVCAFLPVVPSGASSLLDLFTWLDGVERSRLAHADIDMRLAVGLHPRSIPPACDIEMVLDRVRSLVEAKRAAAIGEIGLETGSDEERDVFFRQLCLARDLCVPAIVHTPRKDKAERVEATLRLIDQAGIAPERVVLDHLTPELVAALDAQKRGFWIGITLQPGKTTPEQIADLIGARGAERLLLNSDLSHMPSNPDAVSKAARRLGELGIAPLDIARVTSENAARAIDGDSFLPGVVNRTNDHKDHNILNYATARPLR